MKSPDAFGIAVVSAEAFAGLRQGYMFYSVKYGDTDTDAFKSELAADSEIVRWVDKEDNMRISFIEGDIKGIGPMGTVLPMAILLVTCVMVAVVLWRLLKREFTQIGVFYAIGYRKHEILRHYMRYPVLIATAGGITGTALSIPFIRPFIAFVSTFYNLPVFRVTYRPGVFILSVVLPFLFLLPTALFVIWKALRLSPLQLLKGGVKKTKSNFFERTLRLRRFRFSTKFRIREVVRNIPRSLLMLLGVVCASALLLIGFGMKDSMDYLLSNSFENTFRYNYIYMFNSLQTEEPEQGEKVSLSTFKVLVENYTETVTVYGIEESAALIRLTDAEGRKLDYNQVIITRSLADRYGLSPGDTLSVQNTYTLEKFTLQVDAVAAYYLGDEIYMPLDRFNGMMGYPSGSYLELYTEQKLSAPVTEFVSVTDRSYIEKSFQSLMAPLRAMSGIIGVLSFGIGLIILYVVTSLVIEENRDSISLMKVLGYDKKRLYGLILSPYTAFVIVGYGLAVPLILVSLQQFFQEMTAEMSMSIPARLDPWSILFGFVILMFSYQLSKWLNRRKINRVSMSETLKSARE